MKNIGGGGVEIKWKIGLSGCTQMVSVNGGTFGQ
jgi:hypothetical protein